MPKKSSIKISIDSSKDSDVSIVGSGIIGIEENNEYNLAVSANRLANALQRRLPTYEKAEIEHAANVLLDRISEHISKGDQIAFVQKTKGGKFNLTTLTFEKDE